MLQDDSDEKLAAHLDRVQRKLRADQIEMHQAKRFFISRVLPLPVGVLCLAFGLSIGVVIAAAAYTVLGLITSPEREKFAYELTVGTMIAFGVLVGSAYLLPEVGLATEKAGRITLFIDHASQLKAAGDSRASRSATRSWIQASMSLASQP